MTTTAQIQARQTKRIAEFAKHGIKVRKGAWLGSIELSAGQAEKVLRMLRGRNSKAEKAQC